MQSNPQQPLITFARLCDFFIGIDSDGCAFDTMEVKHKECFIPNIIKYYRLAAISKYAREAAEFLNLYSKWRGVNRFPGLVMTMDLLAERPEVMRRHPRLPALQVLREWIEGETRLANPALLARVQATGDLELALALEWSEAVNRTIAEVVKEVPPFPFVRESLESMAGKADVMVVSATPGEALAREWNEHGLRRRPLRLECGAGQRCSLLSSRPRLRRRVVAAVLRGGTAAVFRGHLRGRIHGRANCPLRGALAGTTSVEVTGKKR
jgi:hypothetical protein